MRPTLICALCLEFVKDLNRYLWIGLHDKTTEGKWEWEDGMPVSTTNWVFA